MVFIVFLSVYDLKFSLDCFLVRFIKLDMNLDIWIRNLQVSYSSIFFSESMEKKMLLYSSIIWPIFYAFVKMVCTTSQKYLFLSFETRR